MPDEGSVTPNGNVNFDFHAIRIMTFYIYRKNEQSPWQITHSIVRAEELLRRHYEVIQIDVPITGLPIIGTRLALPDY